MMNTIAPVSGFAIGPCGLGGAQASPDSAQLAPAGRGADQTLRSDMLSATRTTTLLSGESGAEQALRQLLGLALALEILRMLAEREGGDGDTQNALALMLLSSLAGRFGSCDSGAALFLETQTQIPSGAAGELAAAGYGAATPQTNAAAVNPAPQLDVTA